VGVGKDQKNQKLGELLKLAATSQPAKLWLGIENSSNKAVQSDLSNKVIATGFKPLDEQLHSRGWLLGASTEFGLSTFGVGELRLLIPALRTLMAQPQSQQNIVFITPPHLPFASAFIKEHIDINKLLIVRPPTIKDTLWATEQALLAECCAAVVSWTGHYDLTVRELRRLQLAAEKTRTWNVLFRHYDCLQQASPSSLRIQLQSSANSQLELHIIKQPLGWGGQRCTLSLSPHYENWQRLPASLLPQHNQEQTPTLPKNIAQSTNIAQPTKMASLSHIGQHTSATLLSPVAALRSVH